DLHGVTVTFAPQLVGEIVTQSGDPPTRGQERYRSCLSAGSERTEVRTRAAAISCALMGSLVFLQCLRTSTKYESLPCRKSIPSSRSPTEAPNSREDGSKQPARTFHSCASSFRRRTP